MKIITILLSLAGFSTLAYFLNTTPITTEISVLRDITDKHLAQPNETEIQSLINLNKEKMWNGAVFIFSNLSDVSFNEVSKAELSKTNKWLGNELERSKEISKFNDKVNKIISESRKDSVGKKNSSLYAPLFGELNRLSKSKSERRILLIYSDLKENSLDNTFYRIKDADQKELIEQSVVYFEKLPDLAEIEIFLIYKPSNIKEDKQFTTIAETFKHLLENKGAIVHIVANLQ